MFRKAAEFQEPFSQVVILYPLSVLGQYMAHILKVNGPSGDHLVNDEVFAGGKSDRVFVYRNLLCPLDGLPYSSTAWPPMTMYGILSSSSLSAIRLISFSSTLQPLHRADDAQIDLETFPDVL